MRPQQITIPIPKSAAEFGSGTIAPFEIAKLPNFVKPRLGSARYVSVTLNGPESGAAMLTKPFAAPVAAS